MNCLPCHPANRPTGLAGRWGLACLLLASLLLGGCAVKVPVAHPAGPVLAPSAEFDVALRHADRSEATGEVVAAIQRQIRRDQLVDINFRDAEASLEVWASYWTSHPTVNVVVDTDDCASHSKRSDQRSCCQREDHRRTCGCTNHRVGRGDCRCRETYVASRRYELTGRYTLQGRDGSVLTQTFNVSTSDSARSTRSRSAAVAELDCPSSTLRRLADEVAFDVNREALPHVARWRVPVMKMTGELEPTLVLIKEKRYAEARASLDAWLARTDADDPQRAAAIYNLAVLDEWAGRPTDAYHRYQDALELDPRNRRIRAQADRLQELLLRQPPELAQHG